MGLNRLALAALLALGSVGTASAVTIVTPNGAINADAIDWNYSSFLAEGGVDAVTNWTPNNQTDFTVYSHAKMTTYSNGPNSGISPAGINTNWEITIVTAFDEAVTAVLPGSGLASFQGQATSGFFRMYLDTAPNANDLTGGGFGDGSLIASGTLSNNPAGNFTVTDTTPVDLDQYNGDDWGGQQTVSGFGSNNTLVFDIDTFDSSVFTGGLTSLSILFNNVSMGVPYLQVDPSKNFTAADGTLFAPQIGALNGSSGPDFLAQTDFNSALRATVPVPATAALFGAGLIGLGALARRKQQQG